MKRAIIVLLLLVGVSYATASNTTNSTNTTNIICPRVIDIVMVVDESGSIGSENFTKVKTFLAEVVSRFSVATYGAHFGLVKYSGDAQTVFSLGKYNNTHDLQTSIQTMNYRRGGTLTGLALQHARDHLFNQASDRPYIPNVLVLFSDGESHDHGLAMEQANLMKAEGVEIICVGIGRGKLEDVLKEQLIGLASQPSYFFETVFHALDTIEDSLAIDVCEAARLCNTKPCQNNGTCTDTGDFSYDCNCTLGYTGDHCEIYDACHSNPCLNNGTCSTVGDSYQCDCAHGYSGTNCEIFDPCSVEPCLNNGTCVPFSENSYQCTCPDGYSGTNCETYDPCYNSPCLNNGVCSAVGGNTYQCTCVVGYSGTNCEIEDFIKKGCRRTSGLKGDALLFDRRNNIDWGDGWDQFLDDIVLDCFTLAKQNNYEHFWIEFYGECRAKNLDLSTLASDAPGTSNCWGKKPDYSHCAIENTKPICIGIASYGHIYEVL